MNGVVCHVKEERLIVFFGVVQCFYGFQSQCFTYKSVCSPVFIQSRNGKPRIRLSVRPVSIIVFTQITGQSASCMSGNVHFKSHVIRTLSRSIHCAEVCFSAMNRMVAIVFQNFCQRGRLESMVDVGDLTNTVNVPVRYIEYIARTVCLLTFGIGPVCHPVTGGIRSRNQAAAGRRTDTAGIGLREHYALFGKTFHVRGFVHFIIVRFLCPER